MIDLLRRPTAVLPSLALVLVAVTACTVPAVGQIAVSRLADGTSVAHVRICDGSGPIDGLTLHDDGDLDLDATTSGDRKVTDRSSWPIAAIAPSLNAEGTVQVEGSLSVYGWTRDNSRSLVGPDGDLATWEGLGPADLMYLDSPRGDDHLHVTTVSDEVSVEQWYARACEE